MQKYQSHLKSNTEPVFYSFVIPNSEPVTELVLVVAINEFILGCFREKVFQNLQALHCV
jgi:hypothetical protein